MTHRSHAPVIGVLLILVLLFSGCYVTEDGVLVMGAPAPARETMSEAAEEAAVIVETSDPVILAAVVNIRSLRVRQGPSTDLPIVAGLRLADEVTVIGRTADSTWLQIEVPDVDTIGWISTEYVDLDGDLATLSVTGGEEEVVEEASVVDDTPALEPEATPTPVAELATPQAPEAAIDADTEVADADTEVDDADTEVDDVDTEVDDADTEVDDADEDESADTPVAAATPTAEAPAPVASTAVTTTTASGAVTMAPTNTLAEGATRSLRVREAPNTEAEVLWGVRLGEFFALVDQTPDGEWAALAIPKLRGPGWVSTEFITLTHDIPVIPTLGTATVATTDGSRLRVRNTPSADAELRSYLNQGEAYQLVAITQDGEWALINILRTPGPSWIATEFITIGPPQP